MYFTIGTSQGSLMSQQPLIDNLDKLEALPIRRFEVFGFPEHLDVRDSAAVVKVAKEGSYFSVRYKFSSQVFSL